MEKYFFKSEGLPYRDYFFSDGRTSIGAHQKSGGFHLIEYHGTQPLGNHYTIFNNEPICFEVNGRRCQFEETTIYPFGLENSFGDGDNQRNYWMCVEGKKVIFCFSNLPKGSKVTMVIDDIAIKKSGVSGERRFKGPDFCKKKNLLGCEIYDRHTIEQKCSQIMSDPHNPNPPLLTMEGKTFVVITSNRPINYKKSKILHLLNVESDEKDLYFAFIFGDTPAEIDRLVEAFQDDPGGLFFRQKERYRQRASRLPQISVGEYRHIPLFCSLYPLYIESVKIEDTGAFRASNTHYWVWGWDMTLPCLGLLNAGCYDDVHQALYFLNRTRNKTTGSIYHAYTHDFKDFHLYHIGGAHNLSFIHLLYRYYLHTGDFKTLKDIYPQAEEMFTAITEECREDGFYLTRGMGTDTPEQYGRRRYAYVTLEMGWWYEACLFMAKMAHILKRTQIKEKAEEIARRIKSNFLDLLYDEKLGYLLEAFDPDQNLKYDVSLPSSLGCMNGLYGEDLLFEKIEKIADFCEENFLSGEGIRHMPLWDKRGFSEWTDIKNNWFFMQDIYLARMFRRAGRGKSLEKMLALYDQLFAWLRTIPEGKVLNDPIKTEGCWIVSHCGRAVYSFLTEVYTGIEIDEGGITYLPCDVSQPVKLSDLSFRDSKWDIEIEGEGSWVEEISVDGEQIFGSYKLPERFLTPGKHKLEITRGKYAPKEPVLMEAVGGVIKDIHIKPRQISVALAGNGYMMVKFYTPSEPKLTLDNKRIDLRWKEKRKIGISSFYLYGEGILRIESGG